MLELLVRYADEHGIEVEPGFTPKEVRWAVVCSVGADFVDVIELGEAGQARNRGQMFGKCPDLGHGELVAGGVVKSHFLVDTAKVVALLGEGADDPKVKAKHTYFVNLLRQASESMPELGGVASLLDTPTTLVSIRQRLGALKARPDDKVTFRTGDHYPVESAVWHDWWRQFRRQMQAGVKEGEAKTGRQSRTAEGRRGMRCMVTGELVDPIRTHPKIKGLTRYGGLAMGDALVSFDKDAFGSYGLAQSRNAAVSEQAASAYVAALNHLIREHGQDLTGIRVVHWFKDKVVEEDDVLPWLDEGAERQELNAQERARTLLSSVRSGRRADLMGNRFYAMGLSGSGGRVMVRDWMEGGFEELVSNVVAWFEDLELADLSGVVRGAPGMQRVIACLVLPKKSGQDEKDWLKPLGAERMALWRAAVKGDRIPTSALSRLVTLNTRFHVSDALGDDQSGSARLLRVRMGLVKAYWNRKLRGRGDNGMNERIGPHLNEDHPSAAYHCGRLMAVFGEIQSAALHDVGASVVQRYYAAASATPALVLGRLARLAQFHLDKIEYRKRREELDQSLARIWASLGDRVPTTLTLEEQSLFAMGYYQQKATGRPRGASPKENLEGEDVQ